jgi:hypothetical protein
MPTEYGRVMPWHARVLIDLQHARRELEAVSEGIGGTIRVGTLVSTGANMSPHERMLIEHDCAKLCLQLALFTDNREFAKASECFAPDGTFSRPLAPGRILRGRAQILGSLSDKPPGDTAQHCCTNIVVDVLDERNAVGTTYFTVYAERGSAGQDSSAVPQRFVFVGVYHDRYVRTDDGWKIQARTGSVRYRCNSFATTERTL